MKSETVFINSEGQGIEQALHMTESTVSSNVKDAKTAKRILLLAEESIETIRHMTGGYTAEYSLNLDDTLCEIRIRLNTPMDQEKKDRINECIDSFKKKESFTDRIRSLLESSYDSIEDKADSLEDLGILKADGDELVENKKDGYDSYIWTMQSSSISGLLSDAISEKEETLNRISESILANLSDDIKVYVFRDSAEMIVQKKLSSEGDVAQKGYAISPEFEKLKKIPVATSRFQVKMVQHMYKNLLKKQKPTDNLSCTHISMPVSCAPSGKLDCLLYAPKDLKQGDLSPAVLLLHGGAFVFPALPYHINLAQEIASAVRCRVFLPDYTLAPARVPPLQQEECLSVYEYLLKSAPEYWIDRDKIVLMGDSAGGTLCAALTLMLKHRNIPRPRAQMLFYPSLDARLESGSMKKYTDVPIVNSVAVKAYYKICDFDHFAGYKVYASPVEADSFEGTPDTYVETAEFDCLHDDGILYADLLQKAGVNVMLNETKGTVHAFDMATGSDIRKKVMEQRISFLKSVLV